MSCSRCACGSATAHKVALLGAIMALLVVAGRVGHPGAVPAFYTDPIILEFLFGAAIGVWFTRPQSRVPSNAAAVGLIALGAGLCVLLPLELDRTVRSGIGCALILVGALALERNGAIGTWRLPRLVGDASYSLYLTHLYTVVPLRIVWLKFHLPGGGLSSTLIFLGLSLAGADYRGHRLLLAARAAHDRLVPPVRRELASAATDGGDRPRRLTRNERIPTLSVLVSTPIDRWRPE